MKCSKLLARWCIKAYVEGMRSEYLMSRMRGVPSAYGFQSFLLACAIGNYPFAYDENGVLYICARGA